MKPLSYIPGTVLCCIALYLSFACTVLPIISIYFSTILLKIYIATPTSNLFSGGYAPCNLTYESVGGVEINIDYHRYQRTLSEDTDNLPLPPETAGGMRDNCCSSRTQQYLFYIQQRPTKASPKS